MPPLFPITGESDFPDALLGATAYPAAAQLLRMALDHKVIIGGALKKDGLRKVAGTK